VRVKKYGAGAERVCGAIVGGCEELTASAGDVREMWWWAGAVCDGRMKLRRRIMPASQEEMRKALKAFKKRMKMTQLDDDSKLGHSPLSKGAEKIVSIQPPSGFGKEIWEELADAGYLKRDGIGFFELVAGKQL
jgi:hypothetical protein